MLKELLHGLTAPLLGDGVPSGVGVKQSHVSIWDTCVPWLWDTVPP